MELRLWQDISGLREVDVRVMTIKHGARTAKYQPLKITDVIRKDSKVDETSSA